MNVRRDLDIYVAGREEGLNIALQALRTSSRSTKAAEEIIRKEMKEVDARDWEKP